jgi:hypothetical protein
MVKVDMPEVAGHVEALVVAIEHVDSAVLQPRLPIQLPQQNDGTCKFGRTFIVVDWSVDGVAACVNQALHCALLHYK